MIHHTWSDSEAFILMTDFLRRQKTLSAKSQLQCFSVLAPSLREHLDRLLRAWRQILCDHEDLPSAPLASHLPLLVKSIHRGRNGSQGRFRGLKTNGKPECEL